MKVLTIVLCFVFVSLAQNPPNIVFVFVDDMGWNDVGYHGSEIMTPNIDSLAAQGRKLENYYVQPLCSPTRGTLMTGRYQIHTCQPRKPYDASEIGGLSLNETLLQEVLQEVGYSTHLVGKWHMGYSSRDYLPTYRGFDTFFGYYNGYADHNTHILCPYFNVTVCANDLHDDVGSTIVPVTSDVYSTNLFTERAVEIISHHDAEQPLFLHLTYSAVHTPLQAPQEYIDLYPDIEDGNRRILAAMMSVVDEGIRNVTEALEQNGMWENTVFVFSSDNGGGTGSSNEPLRDGKNSLFNGGIQAAAFITSPFLSTTEDPYFGLMHVSDWFPTLLHLAGADVSHLELDSFDFWPSLSENVVSPRTEILHVIDPTYPLNGEHLYPDIFDVRVSSAIRTGPWKLMTGGQVDDSDKNLWLFNLAEDPSESTDLSETYPEVVETLLRRLAAYNETAVPVCLPSMDLVGSNPDNFDGNWMPWL